MKVEVRCPSCLKIGFIEISDDEFKKTNRGLLSVNIAERIICHHSFIAYIDKNLHVRDCFIADFHIKIPELLPQQTDDDKLTKSDDIDVVLIKLNLPASLIAYLLRGIFLRRYLVLLNNQDFLYKHIKNLIDYVLDYSFENKVEIITSDAFFKNMDKYKEYIILEGNKIIQDKKHIINSKDLKVERTIVEDFFSQDDINSSLLILKNEIRKSYNLAESIAEFVKKINGKEVQSKEILDHIAKKYNVEINIPYLDFLIEIVENYFNVKVPRSSNISNFLGLL